MNDDCFTSFLCDHCHTEIEATFDLIGQETECPACGAKLTVLSPHNSHGIEVKTLSVVLAQRVYFVEFLL